MIKVFDYIYYRLNKFYYKWDGENGSTSIVGLSMIQAMLIGNLCLIFLRCIFTKSEVQNYKQIIISGVFVLLVFFVILNSIIYKNKYAHLKAYWEDEPIQQKRVRGFLVILALALPWFVLSLIGFVNSHY